MSEQSTWMSRTAAALRRNAPWLVLAISLAVTVASSVLLWRVSMSRDRARFNTQVHQATTRALDRLEQYKTVLRGAAGLMSADASTSPGRFSAYVRRQNVRRLYPGALGMGWAATPLDVDTAYVEPPSLRTIEALGPAASAARRAAMSVSRDRGGAQLTGKVLLAVEGGRTVAGFLLYLPVFSGDTFPPPVAERRVRLLGFVYAPVSASEFFGSVFRGNPDLRVSVHDGSGADPASLLYATPGRAPSASRYRVVDTLFVTGHTWTVAMESTPAFEAQLQSSVTGYAFAGGLLAALLLFGLARSLTRAAHAAEAANRAKSAFLATMSHELRTPLNAVIGYADLLEMGVPEPIGPQAREQVGRIKVGAKHLLELIETVLQLARTEAHMEVATLEPVDVDQLIESVVHMTMPLAAKKGLRLEHRRQESGSPIRTDARKLRQICINVLGNAIKFTPAGEVSIEASRNSHDLLVQVTDTGPGIPPEHRDLVFEAFWQADRGHTRTTGGAGLGLAVSRNLARLLGGDLTCDSEPGRGSTFTLRLPLEHDVSGGA